MLRSAHTCIDRPQLPCDACDYPKLQSNRPWLADWDSRLSLLMARANELRSERGQHAHVISPYDNLPALRSQLGKQSNRREWDHLATMRRYHHDLVDLWRGFRNALFLLIPAWLVIGRLCGWW